MIPRTDRLCEDANGDLRIDGVAHPRDMLQYLKEKLDDFLTVVATLARDEDGNHLPFDPRSGLVEAVRIKWLRVCMAAQIVLSSTLTTNAAISTSDDVTLATFRIQRSDAAIGGLVSQLVFLLTTQEIDVRIPAHTIERYKSLRAQLETFIMPDDIAALKVLQAGLHRWSRDKRVRAWIVKKIIPDLDRVWIAQERLIQEQRLIDSEIWTRRRAAIAAGVPFDERPQVIYDRALDPRFMSASTIGRLRDEGQTALADLAEAFHVVMLHDAGEAGALNKLFPRLAKYEGHDMAYLHRCHTGLERNDEGPRFSPQAVDGMIERFKSRIPLRLEKPDGWTVGDLAKQIGKGKQTFRDMRKAAQLIPPARGDHDFRYGPDDVERLATYLSTSTKSTWRRAGAQLRLLLND